MPLGQLQENSNDFLRLVSTSFACLIKKQVRGAPRAGAALGAELLAVTFLRGAVSWCPSGAEGRERDRHAPREGLGAAGWETARREILEQKGMCAMNGRKRCGDPGEA